jgi:hypothetical protein
MERNFNLLNIRSLEGRDRRDHFLADNDVKEPGTFVCTACETKLYKTEHKFDGRQRFSSFDERLRRWYRWDPTLRIRLY